MKTRRLALGNGAQRLTVSLPDAGWSEQGDVGLVRDEGESGQVTTTRHSRTSSGALHLIRERHCRPGSAQLTVVGSSDSGAT